MAAETRVKKGIVLSGGYGTRLRPLTHTGPKQLIPVANKPVLFYAIDDLKEAGITDIGIILGLNMPERVKEALGDGSRLGVKITYIEQGAPKGIAHAVACARDFVGDEPFAVYLGDNILKGGITSFVREFEEKSSDCAASILLSRIKDPQRFGVAELDRNGNVARLVEKPKKPKSDLALVGVYLFRSQIFDAIEKLEPSWRNEYEITEAIDRLVRKYKVKSHIVTGWWKDTGKPEDVLEANQLVLEDLKAENMGKIEKGVIIRGRVRIGKGTQIKKGCFIRGPSVIGSNCKIGPGTYIGPYTSIGDNTMITGGEVDSSIIVGNAKISCRKKIVDSLIGAGSTITSAELELPKGHKLVLGENSSISI